MKHTSSSSLTRIVAAASVSLLLLAALPLSDARGLPRLQPEIIADISMRLPQGWQRQQDDYSLVLTEDPGDPDSAVAALFALRFAPGQTPDAARVADDVLTQLDLGANGIVAHLVDSRHDPAALYRLYRLDKRGRSGYLVSYTRTDPAASAVVHLLFSALDQRFVELGGPAFPLVVYAGMDPGLLQTLQRNSAPAPTSASGCNGGAYGDCVAAHYFGAQPALAAARNLSDAVGDRCQQRYASARTALERAQAQAACNEEAALASQISRMSHKSTMKIIHNMDSGWCYRGEADCE
jgi:hypothetical protein